MSDSSGNLPPPLSCCVMKSQGQQEMRWITLLTLTGPQDTPWKTSTVSTGCWLFKWAGNRSVWVVLLTSRWQRRWWWWEGDDGDRCSAVTSILSHLWVNRLFELMTSLFSVRQPCPECSLVNRQLMPWFWWCHRSDDESCEQKYQHVEMCDVSLVLSWVWFIILSLPLTSSGSLECVQQAGLLRAAGIFKLWGTIKRSSSEISQGELLQFLAHRGCGNQLYIWPEGWFSLAGPLNSLTFLHHLPTTTLLSWEFPPPPVIAVLFLVTFIFNLGGFIWAPC